MVSNQRLAQSVPVSELVISRLEALSERVTPMLLRGGDNGKKG
jgi:hypothetical protein